MSQDVLSVIASFSGRSDLRSFTTSAGAESGSRRSAVQFSGQCILYFTFCE